MSIILTIVVAVFFILFTLGSFGGLFQMSQTEFDFNDYSSLFILITLAIIFGVILFTGGIKIY